MYNMLPLPHKKRWMRWATGSIARRAEITFISNTKTKKTTFDVWPCLRLQPYERKVWSPRNFIIWFSSTFSFLFKQIHHTRIQANTSHSHWTSLKGVRCSRTIISFDSTWMPGTLKFQSSSQQSDSVVFCFFNGLCDANRRYILFPGRARPGANAT